MRVKKVSKDSIIISLILLAFLALSLYVRAVLPYESEIFPEENSYKFAADDAVYHMRFVELTVLHFPERAFFDPFTFFPYGSPIHFGPLFTQSIAFFSILLGLGSPSRELIHAVAAFFPAVIGALVIIPVYVVAREVFDRRTGIVAAALIAILPGQFLSRSLLGFTDHHIAEVFYITLTSALCIIAINKWKGVKVENLNFRVIKYPLLYSVAAGVAYGAYVQNWVGAPLFFSIFIPFVMLQYIMDSLARRDTRYLLFATIPTMCISLLMSLQYIPYPIIGGGNYTLLQPLAILSAIMMIAVCEALSRLVKRMGLPILYPFALLGVIGVLIGIATAIFPPTPTLLYGMFSAVFVPASGGGATIAEAGPIRWEAISAWFSWAYIVYILSLPLLFIHKMVYRERGGNPGTTFVFVWGVVMLMALGGQNRWAYYLAVNVAINVAYFIVFVYDQIVSATGMAKEYSRITSYDEASSYFSRREGKVIAASLSLMLLFFASGFMDNLDMTLRTSSFGPGAGSNYMDWYYALRWMRENTPDPADGVVLNFTKIYDPPIGGHFSYPKKGNGSAWWDYETAYGVMSWWDYGHIITFYAHRIPNANPFQAGIGVLACPERDPYECEHDEGKKPNLTPGAAPFLVETDEDKANRIAEMLGVRYVMSDWAQATGKFFAVATWAHGGNMSLVEDIYYATVRTREGLQRVPSMHYFRTMEMRMHLFDGTESRLDDTLIPPLKHYRLIYESPTTVSTFMGREMKDVKVFEYVKGARIVGKAPPSSEVVLNVTIRTNQGRTFNYTQTTLSNESGWFTFIVPYSNEIPREDWTLKGWTRFATRPITPYVIRCLNTSATVEINETSVMEGLTVAVDLER